MRDPMSGSSTVDIIGNHTTEQKSYTIIVTSDKELETNLKEANNPQSTSLLTCTTDDPNAALETKELEEEKPARKWFRQVSQLYPCILLPQVTTHDLGEYIFCQHFTDINYSMFRT